MLFEERRFSEKCWTHDLNQLLDLAGLSDALDSAGRANPELKRHWEVARGWNERSRYKEWDRPAAEKLVSAICHSKDGVLPWIKNWW